MSELKQLQSNIRSFSADRNWDQFHNLKDLLISLSLESAEALEHVQWKNKTELQELIGNKELAEELADVLYWLLLSADKAQIDLSQAFTNKMIQNEAKYPIEKSQGNHKKYTELV